MRRGAPSQEEPKKLFYVPVRAKFASATVGAVLWLAFSALVASVWANQLSTLTGAPAAWILVAFMALIPGFLNMHLLLSVMFDDPPPLKLVGNAPPVTVLIAGYNEEENVLETFRGLRGQDYPGKIEIVFVDDGSSDRTRELLYGLRLENLRVVACAHCGKAGALNAGLKYVSHDILVTIDADTFLHPQALRRIVSRLRQDPVNTAAVAGTVLVKNSRAGRWARMQEWDYFVAIASAKKQQCLYQGTLVAQGAFSAFKTPIVKRLSGWPDAIGEDIVFTWRLLKHGYRIGYEATAIGFTKAPVAFSGFSRQRQRWARGLIEGLKAHGDLAWRRPSMVGFFVATNRLYPVLDTFYSLAFIPGVALALAGRYWVVGPMTVLVIPLALAIMNVTYGRQKRVFDVLGLKVRRNRIGFLLYLLFYQAILSPLCLAGYVKELARVRRVW